MDAAREKGHNRIFVPSYQMQTFQDFLSFAHVGDVPRCDTVRFRVDEPYDPYLRDYKLDIDLWRFGKRAEIDELCQIAMYHLNNFNTGPFRPEHVKHAIRMYAKSGIWPYQE